MRTRKDYLSVHDLTHADLRRVLDLAAALKRDRAAGRFTARPLAHKQVALMFEKPSLRTRMTFVVAVRELGGDVIEMPADTVFGGRESLEDVARNVERWVSAVVARTFEQARLAAFAAAAPRLHVVNALTNEEHPCQVLADMLTLEEHLGRLPGRVLAYVGDGNNVATSLAQAGAMLGVHVRIATPEGFELRPEVVARCRDLAAQGATLTLLHDPQAAVSGADAVYTDVWTSMGQEADAARREAAFRPYQVNAELMAAAAPGALFMHCLPAHRGQEVTDAVIDSPASVVFDQAENRLHTQKALLALLMS
ncbi:MAG: ornithine carbamoyltransferase [Acidobacteria bacterium]|nr:ornithine carbamoyltransferase [Acidobacteriota bacterium]